jgi:hypothetical protein
MAVVREGKTGRTGRFVRRFGFLLAVVLALAGQVLVARRQVQGYGTLPAGAALYAVAAALTVLSFRRRADASRREDAEGDGGDAAALPRGGPIAPGVEAALIALLVLGAFWIRVHRIDLLPPGLNNDEAINAIEAQEIGAGKPFASLTIPGLNRETLFHHLAAFSQRHPFLIHLLRAMPALFDLQPTLIDEGNGLAELILPLRSVSVGAGVLTVLLLYLFARHRFGWPTAALAAAFLAVSPWHLLYSRVGLRAILAPLFAILTVWLFQRARESGRLPDHLAWGAAMTLGFWSFTSFRAVPVALLVFLLARRWLAGGADAQPILDRGMQGGVAVAAVGLAALMLLSPIGPFGFLVRGAYATLVTPQADYPLNLVTAFLLPHLSLPRFAVIQSDAFISDGVSAVFGLAGTEPETIVVAALGAIGLLYAGHRAIAGGRRPDAAARRRDLACAVVLIVHLVTVLTVGSAGPSLTRMLISAPWVALFAALAATRMFAILAALRRPLGAWAGGALLAILVVAAATQGYRQLFVKVARSEVAMQHFGPTQTIMGMFVRVMPPGPLVYVLHTLRVDSLKYLIGPRPEINIVADPSRIDLDAIIEMPRTAVLVVENARPFAEVLRYLIMRYPQGDMTQVADARFDPDTIIFYTFTLWKDESGKPIAPPNPGLP